MKKIVLLFSLIVVMACSKKEVVIQDIPFEFGVSNAEPNLVSHDGKLILSWISSEKGKEAQLLYTQLDNGKWKSPEKVVSGSDWFVNWADFPANAISKDLILTSYLKKSANGTYTYDIVLNLQKLTGESVKSNFLLNTDGIKAEHGFVSMIPNLKGGFFVTWLDGRNTVGDSDKMHTDGHHGMMTIRTAEIAEDGAIFNEHVIDSSTCDCCQTSITMTQQGLAVVYRDRSKGEIRDIYISRRINGIWEEPKPVFNDGWKIAGCPVNGPKIVSNNNNVAVAWFTAANNEPIVNLSFSLDGGSKFETPIKISDATAIGRVDVVFLNSKEVLVSYMENDENGTFLKVKKVTLDGEISETFIISKINSGRSTGVPQLEILDDNVYVVWTISEDDKNQLKSVKFNPTGI